MIETKNGLILLDESSYQALLDMGYTQAEAIQMVKDAMQQSDLKTVVEQRLQAYKREADALFIEWQFDQTPEAEQAWRSKVEEIKARFPKPMAKPAA